MPMFLWVWTLNFAWDFAIHVGCAESPELGELHDEIVAYEAEFGLPENVNITVQLATLI